MLFVCCRFSVICFSVLNVAAVFLTDLNTYVVVVDRTPLNTALQGEHLLSFISDFCIDREYC